MHLWGWGSVVLSAVWCAAVGAVVCVLWGFAVVSCAVLSCFCGFCWLVWVADGKEKRLVKTSSERCFWQPKFATNRQKIDLGGLLGALGGQEGPLRLQKAAMRSRRAT